MPFTAVLFLFFILPLVTCPSWGQVVQKKQLTPFDYHLWGEVHLDKISPDEQWISYSLTYENGVDTVFVRNINNLKTYHTAGGYNTNFTRNLFFISQSGENLELLNLQTGTSETISGVHEYSYNQETNHLIYLITSDSNKNTLVIRSLADGSVKEIQEAEKYSMSPKGNWVVYSSILKKKKLLSLINLKKLNTEKWIHIDSADQLDGFTWQMQGNSISFLASSAGEISNIFFYNLNTDKLSRLNPQTQPNFPSNTAILYQKGSVYNILISADSQRVFFHVKEKTSDKTKKTESDVEIWNGNDKWIHTQEKHVGDFKTSPKVAVWQPPLNQFNPISSEELPSLMLSGDFKSAILSNPKDYEPQFEDEGPRDYYILDLSTFEKKLLLKRQSLMTGAIIPSPSGKYIAYFKENNWWVYDISTGSHKNITIRTGAKFIAKERQLAPETFCGSPGWTTGDKEILIYDQYDLWAISPDGNNFRKLTHGRELKISYRIAKPSDKKGGGYLYNGPTADVYDLSAGLFLRAKDEDLKTGYYKWNEKTGEKPIVFEDRFIDELHYNFNGKHIFYRNQKFDKSPELFVKNLFGKTISLFESNPQQQKYFWGRSELIKYKNSKGENLHGALFYPANYDPQKKYPMIVEIYEIESKNLHIYDNPTLYNENGFNISVLTTQGYFVFLPDIIHEDQNPGISAADCVISGTKEVLEKKIIDPDKIGLAGHSFGGYESAFIITQTSIFKAAVASGAITDLNSFFYTVSQLSGKPDMWRFATEQWRMKAAPYEAPLSYNANSPITMVDKITTPVLIWTGKKDEVVDTDQSQEFYLALRRLRKQNIMLLYPDESHLIVKPANQKDISQRILNWFDYFLKEDHSFQWINDGIE
ncbi:S9 family peptidase [Flavobacterium sp. Root420]|uniref:alpha/beta hydrolase family protein n=1 Tax=Flavobacterium sp. Root420 TaxID=1736533 RepID=UPI0018E36407|nr:prolyl oligopeptidase family serine peptidase [Flavobacterium sp. Root420]